MIVVEGARNSVRFLDKRGCGVATSTSPGRGGIGKVEDIKKRIISKEILADMRF